MKRQWIALCAGVAVVLALTYWLLVPGAGTPEKLASARDPLLEAATLAVKGVSLLQGEKGIEFWRLKAEWAAMQQNGDVIDVREPKVRYTLGEGQSEDYVYVSSELGRVTDAQRVLTLWQHVKLTRNNAVVNGPKLVYTADDRNAVFPEGADLDTPELFGTFTRLRWSMGTNRIDGEGGVDITFKAREPQAGASDTSDSSGL